MQTQLEKGKGALGDMVGGKPKKEELLDGWRHQLLGGKKQGEGGA